MPSPLLQVRIPRDQLDKIDLAARIYGENTPTFVRELLACITSGDHMRVAAFMTRYSERLTGQVEMHFQAAQEAVKQAKKGKRRAKR